jgi:Tol biopolymer transport system component
MNADGRNSRPILSGDPNQWVQTVQWSPAGDRLAVSIGRPNGTALTRVIHLNGNILSEIPGLWETRWSPSGGHLSGIRTSPAGIGGYQAMPVVFDTVTGEEWAIGPATYSYGAPAWSLDGNYLAFVCTSGYIGQPDGTLAIEEGRDCHGDGLRVVSADGSNARVLVPTDPQNGGYLFGPSWSPSGQTVAVSSMQQGDGCRGYALVDVASGTMMNCISPPGMASFNGGGCGGPSMSAPTWTADGWLVFSAPSAGQTGVFVHDLATGERSFIPNMNAGPASLASSGEQLTFAGGGYICVAGLDGSNLTLLAEGHSPAWQPLP